MSQREQDRLDFFLAKMAGEQVDGNIEPETTKEHYLNKIAENGGSGYTVTKTHEVIFPEQEVTLETDGDGASAQISGIEPGIGTLIVTINGAEYTVGEVVTESGRITTHNWGDLDLEKYPFLISWSSSVAGASILMASAGTITLKVESAETIKTVTPSEDFAEAVKKSGAGGMFVVAINEDVTPNTLNKTFAEIQEAVSNHQVVALTFDGRFAYLERIVGDEAESMYSVSFWNLSGDRAIEFEAASPSDYPVLQG